MIISGLQKLTLLDYPGNVACTIFTGGCNLRCPFCHNASIVIHSGKRDNISSEEFFTFLKSRTGKLDGVCITGGEPLIQTGIEEFIADIKMFGYKVKLDTNGCFPEKLKQMINDELIDNVAMDIKNSPAKYPVTVGINNFDITPVYESITFLLSGTIPYEFRTTVVKEFHTPEDISAIAQWIKGAEHYYLQTFIDSDDVITSGLHGYDKDGMGKLCQLASEYIPNTEVRGI